MRGGGGRGGRGGRDRGGGGRGRGSRGSRDFGPNGHDYHLSEDAGENASGLSEEDIHGLLAERLQAKMRRNFDVADSIQTNLINEGVYVHDGMKEWRADGIPFGDFGNGRGPGRTAGSRSDRNKPYTKSHHSGDLDNGVEDEIIDQLVQERSKYKMIRSFDEADAIREELKEKYNVLIDDRLREWSVDGDFGAEANAQRELAMSMSNRGYIKSSLSQELSPEDEEYVTKRIEERSQAKSDRDFDTADAIRTELETSYNVIIQDKLKQWSVGGDFGADGPNPRKPRGEYTRRGGGDLSDDDVETINKILSDRYKAKKNRNFHIADELRDYLRDEYEVAVDDKAFEWRVDNDEYVQVWSDQDSAQLSQDEIDDITIRLSDRFQCKKDRDYDRADAIREELNQEYGVKIDDRNKEWRVEAETIDDRNKEWRVEAETIDESLTSQTSEFEDKESDGEITDEMNAFFDDSSKELIEDKQPIEENLMEIEDIDTSQKEETSSMSEEQLSSLTVVQLKDILREKNLPVSGKKSELIDRLIAA